MHSRLCATAWSRVAFVAVGQRAELVGERLAGLVLEGVRVDGVEADAERLRPLGELAIVADLVPRKVGRAGRRRAGELVDRRAVLELVEDAARLARTGKPGETRAAGPDAPGRHGDGEGRDPGGHRVDVEPPRLEAAAEARRSPRPAPPRAWRSPR